MKKYKKLIAVTLLLVMMFNIVDVKTVEADINTNLMKAYIIFASILNAYSIHTSVKSASILFDNYLRGNSITADDFVTQGKNFISNGIINVGQLGVGLWGINNWIKNTFKKGYNEQQIITGEEWLEEDINGEINFTYTIPPLTGIYEEGQYPYENTFNMYIKSNNMKYKIRIMKLVGIGFQIKLEIYKGEYKADEYAINKTSITSPQNVNVRCYVKSNRFYAVTSGYLSKTLETQCTVPQPKPDDPVVNNVLYYAGQGVDYPENEYPEEKPLSLPVPNFESDKFRYDEAGNKVYDGTIDDFLNDAFNNQTDYYDKSMDYLIGQTGTATNVNVNTGAGTIAWDNAGTQTWPETGVDIPDLTYPVEVGDAINEQTGVITSIANWLSNVFSEPTEVIDFGPLAGIQIKEKFPFCLPYDLSALITGLNAKGKAPEFEFAWDIDNENYKIELKFEQFQWIADIVQWFILIIFIVALIMNTRQLIGG